jgi:hypothetical protein
MEAKSRSSSLITIDRCPSQPLSALIQCRGGWRGNSRFANVCFPAISDIGGLGLLSTQSGHSSQLWPRWLPMSVNDTIRRADRQGYSDWERLFTGECVFVQSG